MFRMFRRIRIVYAFFSTIQYFFLGTEELALNLHPRYMLDPSTKNFNLPPQFRPTVPRCHCSESNLSFRNLLCAFIGGGPTPSYFYISSVIRPVFPRNEERRKAICECVCFIQGLILSWDFPCRTFFLRSCETPSYVCCLMREMLVSNFSTISYFTKI